MRDPVRAIAATMRPSLSVVTLVLLSFSMTTFISSLPSTSSLGPKLSVSERNLEEDITYAWNNATLLQNDLDGLRGTLMAFYEYITVTSAVDFNSTQTLMLSIGVDPVEVMRFAELLRALHGEIRIMTEDNLAQAQKIEFQCSKIKHSLSLNLSQLAADEITLDFSTENLMLDLSTMDVNVNTFYAIAQNTVLTLIEGQTGPEVDEINQLLLKIQTDLGVETVAVQIQAQKTSATSKDLGSIMEWIILQIAISTGVAPKSEALK
ncbi:hypothetical protein B566_EDAN007231 [Ephemera danica]|nr:hypothetical protein B566_EDAN007231 [Ephemera danica]